MSSSSTNYEEHFINSDDGLKLYLRDYPASGSDKNSLPIVCLPGLTRNSKDFHKFIQALRQDHSQSRRMISFDYRGRGKSDWDPNHANYNIVREAQDILQFLDSLGVNKADFIGTSRGGLIIHIIATSNLEVLSSVVLNDVGPELELKGLLDIKSYLKDARKIDSWKDAALAQRELHHSTFPSLSDEDWLDMAKNIYVEKNGEFLPDFDPKVLMGLRDISEETELPALWDQFDLLKNVPILTLRGEHSSLLSQRITDKMDKVHPNHSTKLIPHQGHPPLLESSDIPTMIINFWNKKSPD